MRRIYRTTTALVASLALVTPQLSLAQAEQQQPAPEQQIVPQAETPAQPPEAAEPIEQPAAEPAAEAPEAQPEQAQDQQAETPTAAATGDQPADAPAEAPATEMPVTEPVAEPVSTEPAATPAPPAQKPELVQAKEPQAKPPVVEAAPPTDKPEDAAQSAARAKKMAQEAKKQPAAKPAKADAKATEAAPDKSPAEASSAEADDLRAKLKAKDKKPAAEQKPQTEAKAPAKKPAKEPAKEPQAGDVTAQPSAKDAATSPATDGAATKAPGGDNDKLRKQLEKQNGDQATAKPQARPAELPAPETQAKPNAVAQRAAEKVAPVTAAALLAKPDQQDGKGKVVEEVITRDNARSSAEEFATAVSQGLQAPQQQEAGKKDDGDDKGSDIAKLLLAGAAGFAVGKMLSNDREVALNTGDRVVVTLPDGSQQVIKDENALLYRPGSNVQTETYQDGSTRSTVLREDGSRVVTIRDANMNILRRTLIRADGSETQLIDDTEAQPVRISDLPPAPAVRIVSGAMDEDALREALRREVSVDRRFSLGQVRDIPEVRALVAPVNVPEITFDTGSAAITPDQAQQLATLGKVIRDSVARSPNEIYMIEGYTDAVGSNAANLALSDRRAESVALALTEYFQVPPENMVVQGYGEQFLLIPTDQAERENRRVAVRRITDLLAQRN